MSEVPKGAITDVKELMFAFLGQTIYLVHGLGSNSFITTMDNVRNLHYEGEQKYRCFEYYHTEHDYNSQCFLGDCNIDAHHNNHYLFRHKEDAEAYLEYAKSYTRSIHENMLYRGVD